MSGFSVETNRRNPRLCGEFRYGRLFKDWGKVFQHLILRTTSWDLARTPASSSPGTRREALRYWRRQSSGTWPWSMSFWVKFLKPSRPQTRCSRVILYHCLTSTLLRPADPVSTGRLAASTPRWGRRWRSCWSAREPIRTPRITSVFTC